MKCTTPHGTPRSKLNNNLLPVVRLTNVALGSPLRRSVLRQSVAPKPVIDQDDESERLKRRTVADVERRISNVVVPDMTPRREQEIHQHFQLCLKLFVENKINIKNVWDLKIIDYTPVVLQSQKQIRDYLQLGSTSLDVSAKVYGLRVDDVHSDALKLAHNMTRVANKKGEGDEENQDENDAPPDPEDRENRPSKKKKSKALSLKNKNTVAKNIKSITGEIPKLVNNCFQTRSGVDFNSVTDLRTNTLLLHPYGHCFMNLNTNPAWATYQMVDDEFRKETEKMRPWPLTLNKKQLKICAAFDCFEIDNWDPEKDSHLMDSSNSSYNDVVVYNENGLPVPELDGSVHNFTILKENEGDVAAESSEDERVEAHSAIHVEPEFITDFRPEERNTISGEYSYATFHQTADEQFQKQLLAGPSHWKFKHIRPAARKFSGVIEQRQQKPKQAKKKKKGDSEHVDILNCSLFDENIKYKPRKNPIKYDPERITQQQILFEEKFLSMNIPLIGKPEFFKTSYVDPPKDRVEDEVKPYNYQNPLDSEYCSQPALQSFDDGGVDDNDDGPMEEELATEKCANAEPEMLADVGQLLGDNLVEAPQLVKKNFISYALQPKKLNIKKLKNAVRRCLVTDENSSNIKHLSEKQLKELPIRPTRFRDICKRVPKLMPSSEKDELSCPTVFVALLHLVNEYQLEITKYPNNMTDFEIKK